MSLRRQRERVGRVSRSSGYEKQNTSRGKHRLTSSTETRGQTVCHTYTVYKGGKKSTGSYGTRAFRPAKGKGNAASWRRRRYRASRDGARKSHDAVSSSSNHSRWSGAALSPRSELQRRERGVTLTHAEERRAGDLFKGLSFSSEQCRLFQCVGDKRFPNNPDCRGKELFLRALRGRVLFPLSEASEMPQRGGSWLLLQASLVVEREQRRVRWEEQ